MINDTVKCRVDLCFHRSVLPPVIEVHDLNEHSVQVPTFAMLRIRNIGETRIPLEALANKKLRDRIGLHYTKNLPTFIKKIETSNIWAKLEAAAKRFVREIVTLWLTFSQARLGRFRPGWTKKLVAVAKISPGLLKSKSEVERQKG